ncbi:hypothetical protein BGZ94_003212, partial [Podila epigama]
MQRNNDNKFAAEDAAFIAESTSLNATQTLNGNSSHAGIQTNASAMRAGRSQGELAYEVAGPTIGGMPRDVSPYDPAKIEVAKDNLVDSMNKAHISSDDGATTIVTKTTTTTTTIKPVEPSLGQSVANAASNAGATAAHAVGAAATGAVAAGASLVNAAKNMVSKNDEHSLDSPHPHPIPIMSSSSSVSHPTSTTYTPTSSNIHNNYNTNAVPSSVPTGATIARAPVSAAPTPANTMNISSMAPSVSYVAPTTHMEPIRSTGLDKSPAASIHSSASSIRSIGSDSTPVIATYSEFMAKNPNNVATAGVIGSASATGAAPPVHETVHASHKGSSAADKTSPPSSHSSSSEHLTPSSASAKEEHPRERRGSIRDKVKNVFHRRPSAQAQEEAAAAAAAAAAAEEAKKPKAYDPKSDRFEAVPETPYTSSGAPKADLHAAPGKPAVRLDAHPTKTLNQGTNPHPRSRPHSPSLEDQASRAASTATTPVIGAASTLGATAAGAKDATVGTLNNISQSVSPIVAPVANYNIPT